MFELSFKGKEVLHMDFNTIAIEVEDYENEEEE